MTLVSELPRPPEGTPTRNYTVEPAEPSESELPRPPETCTPPETTSEVRFVQNTETQAETPNQVIERLARRVKHLQSTDPGARILWAQHCVAVCNGTKDPSRHEK